MADEYTPTTGAIRKVYSAAPIVTEKNRLGDADVARNALAFDRWLAAHDAEIRRDQAQKIIRALEDLPGEDGEAVSARSREGYLLAISESVEEVRAMLATPSPETEQEPRFLYAGCDGSGGCSALHHVHGCFTEHGRDACDTPDAHDSGETE